MFFFCTKITIISTSTIFQTLSFFSFCWIAVRCIHHLSTGLKHFCFFFFFFQLKKLISPTFLISLHSNTLEDIQLCLERLWRFVKEKQTKKYQKRKKKRKFIRFFFQKICQSFQMNFFQINRKNRRNDTKAFDQKSDFGSSELKDVGW